MKNMLVQTTLKLILVSLFLAGSFLGHSQEKFGGLALYTIRDDMDNDPIKTLQAVADAGYKYIESAGYNDGKFYN